MLLDITVEADGWLTALPELFDNQTEDPSAFLRQAVDLAMAHHQSTADTQPASIAIAFSDDGRVAQLNGRFRGKDRATNVLSFPDGTPAGPEPDSPIHLGDLALALETVLREADAQKKSKKAHATHLVVHGVLHLLGYDHDNEDTALEMETIERHILAELGIGDPYEPQGPTPASGANIADGPTKIDFSRTR